jgi:outer membrane protein assembly factor BamB
VRRITLPSAAFLALLACAAARAENWPQWRGPNLDGVSRETNLPAEWGPDKNIAWKLKLPGMGGSTPAVWGDRIFLTCEDGADLVLMCVGTDGKELWKGKVGAGRLRSRGDEGNGASASPCTDGKHVYAFVGTGDFACFDFDGKEVWRFSVHERYGRYRTMHGLHTAPVLHGDRLYLALIHTNGSWVVALDKADGKDVWKVERKSDGRNECKDSYATPTVWSNGKDAYLVVHGNDYTTAHRLDDGSEIWRLGDLNPPDRYNEWFRFVASPVATPELIVSPTAKNGPVVGVKPDATGLIKAGGPGEQWRRATGTPDVSSPLVHGGLVYLSGERGQLTCLDAKTGQTKYSEKLHAARYRASPVYADGKVYLTARDGVMTVVAAGPKFKRLAENKLPDETAASPAVSGGRIYLRGFAALYAIGPANR